MTEELRVNAELWKGSEGQPVAKPEPDPAKPLYEEITRLRAALAASEARVQKARNDALEEAAKAAEVWNDYAAEEIAAAIRAMIAAEKP